MEKVCLQSSFASHCDLSDLLPGFLSFRDYRNGEKEGILVFDWPCPTISLGCDGQSLELIVPTIYTSLQEQSYKEGVEIKWKNKFAAELERFTTLFHCWQPVVCCFFSP